MRKKKPTNKNKTPLYPHPLDFIFSLRYSVFQIRDERVANALHLHIFTHSIRNEQNLIKFRPSDQTRYQKVSKMWGLQRYSWHDLQEQTLRRRFQRLRRQEKSEFGCCTSCGNRATSVLCESKFFKFECMFSKKRGKSR